MLATNKPHKVDGEMVNSAYPLTSSSQSEEPSILQKKWKDVRN